MNEQLEYFIKYSWLFDPNFENTPIAKMVAQLGPNCLCYSDNIPPENKLNFEQLIFALPNNDIRQILGYLAAQMQAMNLAKTQGVIPWFIDQIGGRITQILLIKENSKNKK